MKKIVLILCVIIPAIGFSQIKPSLPKAEKALNEGKLDEAKSIIDATIASQEFMLDKKGQPAKSAAKAWFIKGLVYTAIDTTSKEQFKSLDANPFDAAKEAFEKAKALDPKAASFVNDPNGFLPMLNDNIYANIANKYFNMAINEYQKNKDYKKTWVYTERTHYYSPKDTMVLSYGGIYFAPAAQEYEKSLEYIDLYHAAGGKNIDSYNQQISIYLDKLKDNDKGLKAVQEAMKVYPKDPNFPKYELDIYVKTNRLPEAKAAMTKQVQADPSNKETWYLLGLISNELKDYPEARKNFEKAFELDNTYFDAAFAIADIAYLDAKRVKQEMNNLGISAADKKKRFDLDKIYVEELKKVLPLWQRAEKLGPDDSKVLDTLLGIYSDLGDQPNITKTTKHMKALGLLD